MLTILLLEEQDFLHLDTLIKQLYYLYQCFFTIKDLLMHVKKNIFCPRILGELAPVFLKQRYKIRLIWVPVYRTVVRKFQFENVPLKTKNASFLVLWHHEAKTIFAKILPGIYRKPNTVTLRVELEQEDLQKGKNNVSTDFYKFPTLM